MLTSTWDTVTIVNCDMEIFFLPPEQQETITINSLAIQGHIHYSYHNELVLLLCLNISALALQELWLTIVPVLILEAEMLLQAVTATLKKLTIMQDSSMHLLQYQLI